MLSSSKDIMTRLIDLDEQLKLLNKRHSPLKFVILGGSAVMIITNNTARTTNDIDVYILDQLSNQLTHDEILLLEKYDINNRLQGGDEPFNFLERIDRITSYPFACMHVYTADPMDVIMHKLLNRGDQRDLDDILLLLDYVVDLKVLKSIYIESAAVVNCHPARLWNIDHIFNLYNAGKGK